MFEATGTDVSNLGQEHGQRVLRVVGEGTRILLVPVPPAVGRAVDRAVDARATGRILLGTGGAGVDHHAADPTPASPRHHRRGPAPRVHTHMLAIPS